ncbi:putative SP-containing protein [Vairimorpha necatrix]|uniref:SP-containing protein n=1 Tax=Vairimorpha necatrix TaxID=6039 RepID=A0AAX4J815_9MICR
MDLYEAPDIVKREFSRSVELNSFACIIIWHKSS